MLLNYYNTAEATEDRRRRHAAERGQRMWQRWQPGLHRYAAPPRGRWPDWVLIICGGAVVALLVSVVAMVVYHARYLEGWFQRWF